MIHVEMLETRPKTEGYGPLKAGKRYALPGGLALQLVEAGWAKTIASEPAPSLAADSPETAAVEPPENAARRTTRPKAKKVEPTTATEE